MRSAAAGDSALAFEGVRADWDRGEYGDRALALVSMNRFRAIYTRDPLVPVASAYLALEALEHDDVAKAQPFLLALAKEPLGSTQHLRVAAEARIARLEHRDRDAFALTSPVVRSVVEPVARNVMLEEHARASLATRPMRDALDAVDMWLNEGLIADRRRAEALVDALLADLHGDALARAYASMSSKERHARYSSRLLGIVKDRLEGNELLMEMEQSVRSQARVRGSVLGVLVQTSTDQERVHAADFLRGLSWGSEHAAAGVAGDMTLYVRELSEQRSAVCAARAELEGAGVSLVALGPDGNLASAWRTCPGRDLPVLLATDSLRFEPSHNPEIQAYTSYFAIPVTPLAARGHDIAVLSASALSSLPWLDTTDTTRIAEHDKAVRLGLATSRPNLWALP